MEVLELVSEHVQKETGRGFGEITFAVVTAVAKIGLLVLVGIRLEQIGMLNGPKRKCLSALAMDVCLPCLMFSQVLPEADVDLLREGWQLMLWPFCYAPVGSIMGVLCCLAVGIPSQNLGSAAVCAAFPNVNGFPVAIIAALGNTIPKSQGGFTAMVFLSLIQLTDGVIKYTLGPEVFRRDLRAVQRGKSHEQLAADDFPLGASLRTLPGPMKHTRSSCDGGHGAGIDDATPPTAVNGETPKLGQSQDVQPSLAPKFREKDKDVSAGRFDSLAGSFTQYGLESEQYRAVEPEWSRFESYMLLTGHVSRESPLNTPDLKAKLLGTSSSEPYSARMEKLFTAFKNSSKQPLDNLGGFLRQLFPPQVTAVLLALAIGVGPVWIKELFHTADPNNVAPLSFVYGTAEQLGGGFVPLQMISLGGRLVNVASESGPLSAKGAAGPRGRNKLLRIAAAVAFARMIITPIIVYQLALLASRSFVCDRPMAFWAPALVVAAMPTANNMSTMADLVGAGRSISASTTALQLLASPVVLALSLTCLLAGAQYNLASDFRAA